MSQEDKLGASLLGNGDCRFLVWAPNASQVEIHLCTPVDRYAQMEARGQGYFEAVLSNVDPGTRYFYRLDGLIERPDPASRSQPEGVHGPSEVMDLSYNWQDETWTGVPLQDYIIYELHVGTFTPEGTFEAIIRYLDELRELKVTAIELLPVAQFPGTRNWGYDGVFPFAVQYSYGGPAGLKKLVEACHRRGLAVILDMVYNHFGPEGNYFPDFGPYFTDRYKTPWGPSLNFDGEYSDEVRRFFLENARMWAEEFHVDALRLDAVDNIFDFSARPFLQELVAEMDDLGNRRARKGYLFIENDLNDPHYVQRRENGGLGLDATWTDDFHHALVTLLTGNTSSYYVDFELDPALPVGLVADALRDAYVYTGQYSSYRKHKRGASARSVPGFRHVVFSQNHDQVGNRMLGERLCQLVSFDQAKLAAGIVLLSPYLPLVFMGEEYAETAPFQYFVDHSDPELVRAVQEGRRAYFGGEHWQGDPPDPTAQETFERSRLNHHLKQIGKHRVMRDFYCELIRLRRTVPALQLCSKENLEVSILGSGQVIFWRRWNGNSQAAAAFNFSAQAETNVLPLREGQWNLALDSTAEEWRAGTQSYAPIPAPLPIPASGHLPIALPPHSFILLLKQ